MVDRLLSPAEAGEQVSSTLETMRAVGATSGQMALVGAHILLENMPFGAMVAEELVGRLEGSGIEEVALLSVSDIGVDEHEVQRQRLSRRYSYSLGNRWPSDKESDESDGIDVAQLSLRDFVMDSDFLGQKEAEALYANFGNIVDGFIAGSPELAASIASLEGNAEQYGYWGARFMPDVVNALTEEGHYDAALHASNQVHTVRNVERNLLKMAKDGYTPALYTAHNRFLAEGTYGKEHFYSEDGNHMQNTGDFFDVALELDLHETASKMFDAVKDINQLSWMIRLAIPDLVDRNDFKVDELLANGLAGLTEKVLLGVINNFDLKAAPEEQFNAQLMRDSHWATRLTDKHELRRIQSQVAIGLGIELCYRGRVAEAEQIEAATITEHGRASELQRFIGLGHFIVSDLDTALTMYGEVSKNQSIPNDTWLRRESIPFLVKRGAIAPAISMAGGVYEPEPKEFGEHSAYLLSLAIAAAHGVYESNKKINPVWLRKQAIAEKVITTKV